MKIAVTAANGQLGRAIIKSLVGVHGKENVIGIARSPEKALDLGVEVRPGDYDKGRDFVTALEGIDTVILVSSMAPPDARVQQHRNVIDGARAASVRKIIYTSIIGKAGQCSFDTIIKSNRQTERDIQGSGLQWIVGRNGLYLDADLDSMDAYSSTGKITNSASDGRCAYTSREELAEAYTCMVTDDDLNGKIFNLCGEAVTQAELTEAMNRVFGLSLSYESMTVDEYVKDRTAAHGKFFGGIIAGIYQGIRAGAFDLPSDFKAVCKRDHLSITQMMRRRAHEPAGNQ